MATADDNGTVKKPRSNTELELAATGCGIGNWHPPWLQRYATPNTFVIIFSALAILQGALFTYMVGIISTLEKRFAFETKVSGFLLIADNLSQMVVSPIVGYLGSKYNRSVLIGMGELVVALSCFLSAAPYFLYGPAVHLLNSMVPGRNHSSYDLCLAKDAENCENGGHSTVILAVVVLWISCFLNGLGYTAFYTIGLPYLDDNIKKKSSAIYLSSISTVRLLGPTLGFVLSSICLQFYENPFVDPGINNRDPRWIGAWWLGFLILGTSILACTIPMFFFPKSFRDLKKPKTELTEPKNEAKISNLKDVKNAVKRLSKNYLLIFHIWGGVFRLIGYLGYYVVKPKYMELQYRQSASSASFFTGATSVMTMAIGTMAGGIIIRYAKPSARSIAIYLVIVEFITTFSMFGAMFLQCQTPVFSGLSELTQLNPISSATCHSSCGCSTRVYQPVCGPDGQTNYFSPCYAGCKTTLKFDNTLAFHNCSCVSGIDPLGKKHFATAGLCERDCNKFPFFIALMAMANTIGSTARTGDTLLTLRSVDPADKSFAMGIMGTIFAIFAFIPYPLIFGAIIDSACLVWEKTCGKAGNCWLYDIDKFRIYMHVGAVSFLMIGATLEIGTVVFAGRIKNFYEDEEDIEMKSVDNGTTQAAIEDKKTTPENNGEDHNHNNQD